ncbi:SPL family radical SAM protein [Archaeoglobus sp. UBA230]|jgi:DNA repair photolyase|uniref:SPL family radical SAM protein n=1 Tax=Archaeoglobus sp. UBA230 TaxID=1915565 RepID=UPI0025C54AFC|nr:radical SAM protein [Archaeoglobus sp. UBA230]
MGVRVIRKKVKSAIGRSNLPGVNYTLNPYTGCSHGCVYCYARLYCPKEIGENWGEVVVVKENIVEVLAKELRNKRKEGRLMLSTITDPYQPLEGKERLTRRILQILVNSGHKVSIQTKSNLVLRDLDLLVRSREITDVGFTVTTLDERLAGMIEPNAPPPHKRVRALERLRDEGIRTWIFFGPVLPEVDEGEVMEIAEIAKATESALFYDKFRVKGFMKTGIEGEIAEMARKTDWKVLAGKIQEICNRLGVKAIPAFGRI